MATIPRTVFAFLGFICFVSESKGEKPPDPIRVSIARSFFRDVPDGIAQVAMQAFPVLMKAQTDLSNELAPSTDPGDLGEKLTKDQLHLAVFQGIEFAWARQKYPELRPLVIAVNKKQNRQAHLMVRKNSKVTEFAELKGKQVAIPCGGREHCRLFLQRNCQECGLGPDDFFAGIAKPNAEKALDDLVDDVVQAVVVDGIALDCYKQRKPGRFAKLKDLQKSELFPDSVVAYHPGVFDEATLQGFRQGLLKAHETPLGRQLLTLWSLTGFENIPEDYEQILTETSKAYPPPSELKTTVKNKEGPNMGKSHPANR